MRTKLLPVPAVRPHPLGRRVGPGIVHPARRCCSECRRTALSPQLQLLPVELEGGRYHVREGDRAVSFVFRFLISSPDAFADFSLILPQSSCKRPKSPRSTCSSSTISKTTSSPFYGARKRTRMPTRTPVPLRTPARPQRPHTSSATSRVSECATVSAHRAARARRRAGRTLSRRVRPTSSSGTRRCIPREAAGRGARRRIVAWWWSVRRARALIATQSSCRA